MTLVEELRHFYNQSITVEALILWLFDDLSVKSIVLSPIEIWWSRDALILNLFSSFCSIIATAQSLRRPLCVFEGLGDL
jgi:hypothetical protein